MERRDEDSTPPAKRVKFAASATTHTYTPAKTNGHTNAGGAEVAAEPPSEPPSGGARAAALRRYILAAL
jgi:hypothetical protein